MTPWIDCPYCGQTFSDPIQPGHDWHCLACGAYGTRPIPILGDAQVMMDGYTAMMLSTHVWQWAPPMMALEMPKYERAD